tara:strand:- start:363 stop:1061 length:699 start_codon:yes stop_codon:yes gene_type:complete
MKNLAIGFASLRPHTLPENVCDIREREYFVCMQQLVRVLPESFDLLICENTIDDPNEIKTQGLRDFLNETELCATGSESNIGTSNKGLGELLQLKTALDQTDIDKYENISYVTTRGYLTCPYVFEKTEGLNKEALLSNPDFIWLNGKVIEASKNLYNDQFFSMKSNVMMDYANYSMSKLDELSTKHIGSEYNLYNFIHENNIDFEWLPFLGRVRNDWSANNNPFDANNFHIC